jgi:hypothetical protein
MLVHCDCTELNNPQGLFWKWNVMMKTDEIGNSLCMLK